MYSTEENNIKETAKKSINRILAEHQISQTINADSIEKQTIKQPNQVTTIDKEINLDPSKTIMSKTDARGIIEYANDYFMEISGYEEYELMGQPHNIIRHPDMPQVVFKLLWDRLNRGENIHAFVKNLAKDGRYYWVLTNFETKYNEEGIIISRYSRRKAAPKNALYTIEKLYRTLRAIELKQGMKTAENYLNGLLEEKRMTYDTFILSVLGVDAAAMESYFTNPNNTPKTSKKRGMFGRLFK
jgi:PAS domain S-box-containing protein